MSPTQCKKVITGRLRELGLVPGISQGAPRSSAQAVTTNQCALPMLSPQVIQPNFQDAPNTSYAFLGIGSEEKTDQNSGNENDNLNLFDTGLDSSWLTNFDSISEVESALGELSHQEEDISKYLELGTQFPDAEKEFPNEGQNGTSNPTIGESNLVANDTFISPWSKKRMRPEPVNPQNPNKRIQSLQNPPVQISNTQNGIFSNSAHVYQVQSNPSSNFAYTLQSTTQGRINSNDWTSNEDTLLKETQLQFKFKGEWNKIASQVGTKEESACQKRWIQLKEIADHYQESNSAKWSELEIKRLTIAVRACDAPIDWQAVSAYVGTRSGESCRKKWTVIKSS